MTFFAARSERAERKKLLGGRPNFVVRTSKSLVAAALWDYGEDALAERAIDMTDEELMSVENISAWYEDPAYPLPVSGQRVTHSHVSAFAAITLFEGRLRPLARARRRPARDRPAAYGAQPPAH
ncbi:hypothetical protein [Intrasporangium sp. YIM S08009]|uniref:hypothetical protein n=1 Tax=Intrasporangium zincisolvens TaxID=3080018 RepID=UPI002B05ED87|nr:hypothetical protein [Intrasporangium sp. YIM S08009]